MSCISRGVNMCSMSSSNFMRRLSFSCLRLGTGNLSLRRLLLCFGLVELDHMVVDLLWLGRLLHLYIFMLHLILVVLNIFLLNLINWLSHLLLLGLRNLIERCGRNRLSRRVLHLNLLGSRSLADLALTLELLLLGHHLLLLMASLILALILLLVSGLDVLEKGGVDWLIRTWRTYALIINLRLYLGELSCLLIEIRSHAGCLEQLHRLQRLLLVLRRANMLTRAEEVVSMRLLYSDRHWLKDMSQWRWWNAMVAWLLLLSLLSRLRLLLSRLLLWLLLRLLRNRGIALLLLGWIVGVGSRLPLLELIERMMARGLLVARQLISLESIKLLLLILQSTILWPKLHLLGRLTIGAGAVTPLVRLVRLLLNALILRRSLNGACVHLSLWLNVAHLIRRLRLRKGVTILMSARSLLLLIVN